MEVFSHPGLKERTLGGLSASDRLEQPPPDEGQCVKVEERGRSHQSRLFPAP